MKNLEIIKLINKMLEDTKYIQDKNILMNLKNISHNWQKTTIMYNNDIRDWWLECIKIK